MVCCSPNPQSLRKICCICSGRVGVCVNELLWSSRHWSKLFTPKSSDSFSSAAGLVDRLQTSWRVTALHLDALHRLFLKICEFSFSCIFKDLVFEATNFKPRSVDILHDCMLAPHLGSSRFSFLRIKFVVDCGFLSSGMLLWWHWGFSFWTINHYEQLTEFKTTSKIRFLSHTCAFIMSGW